MQRYPQFSLFRVLAYPLALSPLVMILILSLISAMSYYGGPIIAILLVSTALFALWYLKYLFLILISTADGNPDCPVLTETLIRPLEDLRHLKFLILLLAHATLMGVMSDTSPVLGTIYLVGFIILLPAMVIVLGIENSFLKTAHLPMLLQIIRHSGLLYWAVFAFYGVSTGFTLYLIKHQTGIFMISAVILYLVMVAFHLLGVILYTRREALGYQANHTPEREHAQMNEQTRKRYLQVADMLYRQQCRAPVLASADRQLEAEPLEAYDFLLDEARTWDNPRFLQRYLDHYLSTYLEADQLLKGMRRYEKVLQQFPDVVISDPLLGERLINKLNELQNEHPNHFGIDHYLGLLSTRVPKR